MRADALVRVLPAWKRQGSTLASGLERAISTAILDGRVARDVRLPSERALASTLGVSRVTVTSAYARLRSDGWVETTRGEGSRARIPTWLDASIDPGPPSGTGDIDLTQAAPMAPLRAYLDALDRAAQRLGRYAQLPIAGIIPELRVAIADRYTATGVPTRPEQVLPTTGAGAALALLARHALRPAARVLVESPTYPGALDLLRSARMRLVGWPVADGRDPDLLEGLIRDAHPSAAYVILDFHNPTGAVASDSERQHLAHAARRARMTLIVDETMRELDLRGDDLGERVRPDDHLPDAFRLESMAKTIWSGLRVGWLRGPRATIEKLATKPEAYYLAPPALEQIIALELLRDYDAVVAARRRQLRAQLATLTQIIERAPNLHLTQMPSGGLTTWNELPAGASTVELVRRAPGHGLRLTPGGRFSPDGTLDRFLRLPFTLPHSVLEAIEHRLIDLLDDVGPTVVDTCSRTGRACGQHTEAPAVREASVSQSGAPAGG